MLRRSSLVFAAAALIAAPPRARAQSTESFRAAADRLIDAAMRDSAAWNRIAELTDTLRPSLERLGQRSSAPSTGCWQSMRADGLENVRGEPVMVRALGARRGVRGADRAAPEALPMLGLGGSVGTPAGGITAPVLVVASFDDLAARGAAATGKIVLFDVPFTELRRDGALPHGRRDRGGEARRGGRADPLRGVVLDQTRRTRAACATTARWRHGSPPRRITVEDAMLLHRMQDRGEPLTRDARDGRARPARRAVAQRRGRAPRAREAGRGGGDRRAHRLVGRGAGRDGRRRRRAWRRGRRCG